MKFAFVDESDVELSDYPQLISLYKTSRSLKITYPFGTAFPIKHAGGIFLLTANHCTELEEFETLHCFYAGNRCGLNSDNCEILQNEELDVAAIFLKDTRVIDLLRHITPIPIDLGGENKGDQVLRVYGFPQSKNKEIGDTNFVPNGVAVSVLEAQSRKLRSSIPSEHRFLVEMDWKTFVDDDGKRSYLLQRFEGLSGGPILKFASRGTGVTGNVCGLFVEWHSDNRMGVGIRFNSIMNWLAAEVS